MFKLIRRTLFTCLALFALVLSAYGVAPAESVTVATGDDPGSLLMRIGLFYLAFWCVLLALDMSPELNEADAEGV